MLFRTLWLFVLKQLKKQTLQESGNGNRLLFEAVCAKASIAQQRHESEIHMKLMVAMKQRRSGTVGNHIHI